MQKDLTELTLVLIESSDEGTIDDEVRIESWNYGQPLPYSVTIVQLCVRIQY